jgi:trk system potassium uptake protein TrkH
MKDILKKARKRVILKPQWLIAGAFAGTILIGTVLLMTPWASATGRWTDALTALFTATSACCVTGLAVVDTGTHFSFFGQIVVLALIQFGGIGIMTLGTFLLVLVGRRLSVQNEFVLINSFGIEEVRGLPSLLRRSLLFTLVFEGAGAAILAWRYIGTGYTTEHAAYYGIFHAVSAYCNAGFALHSDSLISFQSDPLYLGTICALIVFGGLGFLVIYNLSSFKFWRRNRKTRGRVSLHTRLVLVTTGLLLLSSTLLFLATDWNGAFAGMSTETKLTSAIFSAVSPRTAGFNVVPMESFSVAGRFLHIPLMFIGGAPGSTAGGIKITALVVLLLTIAAMLRGRRETHLNDRTIPLAVVREATVIFALSIFAVLFFFSLLLLTEAPTVGTDVSDRLLFETVSAFGTVGLSLDTTPTLSSAGRLVIILCMFIGRLGPLTAALVIGTQDVGQRIRYPEEEVVVG